MLRAFRNQNFVQTLVAKKRLGTYTAAKLPSRSGRQNSIVPRFRRFSGSDAAGSDSAPSPSSAADNKAISMTNRCVEAIKFLREKENNGLLKLRVAVDGGGCSGFQYKFELVEEADENDTVISNQDAELVVDDISLPFLRGSIIDYEKELVRSAFVVTHNPNSDSSCGCGSSFVAKI